jgi:hypothetical protein
LIEKKGGVQHSIFGGANLTCFFTRKKLPKITDLLGFFLKKKVKGLKKKRKFTNNSM